MMTTLAAQKTQLNVLSDCSLFSKVTQSDIKAIASKGEVVNVPKGRVIVQYGDDTSDVYFLLSGHTIGQLMATNGREIMFAEMAKGGYFGELAALDNYPRSMTISASTNCQLLKLNGPTFMDVLFEYPQVSVSLLSDIASIMRKLNDRIYGLVVHDIETRVGIHLMQLAQQQQQLVQGGVIKCVPTHEEIANLVGANREGVSRAITKLKKRGILESDPKSIIIRDLKSMLYLDDRAKA